jgi:SAM-dependent methyltransferase
MSDPNRGVTCNICGADMGPAANAATSGTRETAGCPVCKSTLRIRSLVALLSREVFGVAMALPEFPTMKGIRGLGMSDSPELARQLAEKFDYTNTFYHQAPVFDVTKPDIRDVGRYDFIVSSEVMEHVPPPVERAFQSLRAMLKPDGLLLMTTPYSMGGKTAEHFPDLHEFTLTSLGGRPVLVNRRRGGSTEVFDDLVFHGGHGSTLEMRFFTDQSLRDALLEAGFTSVHFSAENQPEFGVDHMEPFSLPIVARKGQFRAPEAELAKEYLEAFRLAARNIRELEILTSDYKRHIAFHQDSQDQLERDLAERVDWARKIDAESEQVAAWAKEIDRQKDQTVADFLHLQDVERELRQYVAILEKESTEQQTELRERRAELEKLQSAWWTRIGRRLGALSR